MDFGLLGPLLVRREAEEIPIPAARQRVVLAALLLRANQVVPVDELAETLWNEELPATARATLRNYVKRLRQALGDVDRLRIATRGDGYLIGVATGELDLTRFEMLREQAGQCARAGRWAEASAALHTALALWRGEPLADVPSDVLARRELPRLAELRLQATEDRIEANLHLGRHAEVIARLRERLHELLMLALYRAGRQADALAAYRRARAILVGELGIEPGPGLRELHRRILAGDPALAVPPDRAAVSLPSPVPRQLPPLAAHFTGRDAEIKQLSGLMDEASGTAGTVAISAIGGTAGVGKTALAVYWAHQVADRFPDGQLYVNLRGFGPSGTPATPGEAIRGFLAALGVPGERIPAELAAQTGLYRSLLAGKKMLIVAGNARDEAQVRPLLPAGPRDPGAGHQPAAAVRAGRRRGRARDHPGRAHRGRRRRPAGPADRRRSAPRRAGPGYRDHRAVRPAAARTGHRRRPRRGPPGSAAERAGGRAGRCQGQAGRAGHR
jgi:DNA-binding SARP family transcriptional activator